MKTELRASHSHAAARGHLSPTCPDPSRVPSPLHASCPPLARACARCGAFLTQKSPKHTHGRKAVPPPPPARFPVQITYTLFERNFNGIQYFSVRKPLKTVVFRSSTGPFISPMASRGGEAAVPRRGPVPLPEYHRETDRCGSAAEIYEGEYVFAPFRRTTVGDQ